MKIPLNILCRNTAKGAGIHNQKEFTLKNIFSSVSFESFIEWLVSCFLFGFIIFGPMIAFDLLSK